MSIAQSDFNAKTGETLSRVIARKKNYSDLDLSFVVHPDSKDIIPLFDIEAIRNSVRNLVLTNFSERPFQPFLGSNIRALLFEPADPFTAIAIKNEILRVLSAYEPRISGVTVQVFDNSDRNAYSINVGFNIVGLAPDKGGSLEFSLQRLR